MKKQVCFAVLIYSLVLMGCGLLGYQKGSAASLYAGTGLGFLLFLSSIALFFRKKAGLYAATLLTGAFATVFLIRYLKTDKPFLAILAALSGCMLCYLLLQISKWKKN
jgi:uncharacterized membrane protein (UPF0136 family)